jgi:hypothetical protein
LEILKVISSVADPFLQFGSIDQGIYDLLCPTIPILACFAKIFRPLLDPIVLFLSGLFYSPDMHKKITIGKERLFMDPLKNVILTTLAEIHEKMISSSGIK